MLVAEREGSGPGGWLCRAGKAKRGSFSREGDEKKRTRRKRQENQEGGASRTQAEWMVLKGKVQRWQNFQKDEVWGGMEVMGELEKNVICSR